MKVVELIQLLQEQDSEADVFLVDLDYLKYPIESVTTEDGDVLIS